MTNRLLTIDEVSEILHASRGALAQLRHEGRGPRFFKDGRRVLYRESDIDAYIESRIRSGTSEAA